MLKFVLGVVFTFLATTLFGYVVHRLLHRRWTGFVNKGHMQHHLELYPPKDLVSERYRTAGKHSGFFVFSIAGIPMLGAPPLLCYLGHINLFLTVVLLVEMIVYGLLSDFIHDSFHVRSSVWQSLVPNYDELRSLHFVHHRNMARNLGVFVLFWDRVFGTFAPKR